MRGTLLKTKLYVPSARREQIARPRLIELLNRGSQAKLTLVSASAGSGKTTLLAQWLASDDTRIRSTAWLSLDDHDNSESSFWSYVIGALQTVAPGAGATAMSLLESAQPPSIEPVLSTLINDLSSVTQNIVLVLDDYHVIETREIHDGITFLLAHLPPHVHLVIASRADPPLPLPRLRAHGDLVEIRVGELRFRPEEATSYLNDIMGLHLTEREVAALEARTEGWIAALQLAALSMQGRQDVTGFIAQFAGDDRYVVDYLADEVLKRQPEHIRRFLLETSILDRLSGPLCDAVTGQAAGSSMLEALDRGNLFVVPLDDRRRSYRYHQLFADVLRAHLLSQWPCDVAELHRRASKWYALNDEPSEAIRHAFAAQDFLNAANLIERAIPELRRTRQEATLLAWLAALPDTVLQVRPVLNATFAWASVVSGNFEGLEVRLAEVESSLRPTHSGTDIVVVDQAEFRRLPAVMALLRTAHAQARGDVAATVTFAHQVLDLAAEDDDLLRGSAAGFLGLAYWTSGDLAMGHRMYSGCMTHVQRAGHLADVLGCAIALADMRIAQGRLHDAMRTYQDGLRLAGSDGEAVLRGAADMYVGIAEIHREWDDLDAAIEHLLKSKELGNHAGLPQNHYRWCLAMARVRQAQGDLSGALELLEEAERLYIADFFPNVRPVATLKTRVWLARGDLHDALRWANERGLSADDDLSYLRECDHITLARVLLANGSIDIAMRLLERLLEAADEGNRTRSVIEILALQAATHQMRGNTSAAQARLERALALAEPEGYVRMFVDEGPDMQVVLRKVHDTGYVRRLLAAFGSTNKVARAIQSVVEPLSERELEVLRLLGTDLDGPDIASELMVSLNTMRTHTKSIYAKLGVNNRRSAVRRAEELELLSAGRTR